MRQSYQKHFISQGTFPSKAWAEQVFSRTAGAPVSTGNKVTLLKDAVENYPAWLASITKAEKWIHFESYIVYDDETGREFGEVLAVKAREGVKVRVAYDWLGGLGKTSRRFWQKLREAGAEVRCFNPPRLDSPLGWISRDHRKMIAIDGKVAFVTGLCIGNIWAGNPVKSLDPWRDTGIQVNGPAIADIEAAFSQIWSVTGKPLPADELPDRESISSVGNVSLRVVSSTPSTGGLFRLDLQITALARKSLWLTDAYYAGTTPYVQALRSAAMDGVDIRLLVPGSTDIPMVRALSRAGYRPLLEAGVRVFEWNGSMIHAKTAVADGYWARVGSTNLNIASWIGNYELDVVIENEDFAKKMEGMYLADLENATEIVLRTGRLKKTLDSYHAKSIHFKPGRKGSVGRVGAGAIRIGNVVGAAITNHRALGSAEQHIPFVGGIILLVLAVLCVLIPKWVTFPMAIICGWFGFAMLIKTGRLYLKKNAEKNSNEKENGETGIS